MPINRFRQIRAVLHFNNDEDGLYVELGSEWSLDKAIAVCRSSYGHHLIVYNPSENCG